jgi:hypothetical protein
VVIFKFEQVPAKCVCLQKVVATINSFIFSLSRLLAYPQQPPTIDYKI